MNTDMQNITSNVSPLSGDLDTVIKVENLSKVYRLYNNPVDRLKESLNPFKKKYHKEFYALRDINFFVKKGETLGIIGKNGSGKSTLLKILTGVLTPTSGNVSVEGKISSLLELGTGFNPELTGIENIYFSGTVMGYTKEEVDKKVESIVSFADIGDFINQPVKTYSSGMYVRLAFSVAINVDPDVLIVDEALSVGDMRFQQKCFRKIREFRDKNKTIIFVTHDTGAVVNFCDRAIWLIDGGIYQNGEPDDIVKQYIAYMAYDAITENREDNNSNISGISNKDIQSRVSENFNEFSDIEWEDVSPCASFGDGGAKISRVSLYSKDGYSKVKLLYGGERVILFLEIEIMTNINTPIVGFILNDEYGNRITGLNNIILEINFKPFIKGTKIIVEFELEIPFLRNGNYTFSPAIAEGTQENHIQHHWIHDAYIIKIANKSEVAKMGWYFLLQSADMRYFPFANL